ncbi:MAG TPA: hypothetical protein VJZ71_20260 [Phycisphaerae bacterium]|nr:hypothetical protein [Phycisphaerae bacterium]
MPRRKGRNYLVLFVLSVGPWVQNAPATLISYAALINDAGPSGTLTYGSDGYDLYATSLDGEPTSSGPIPFGPVRLSSLPPYITSVTTAGANSYYRSNSYANIVNPQTGTLVHSGLTYHFSPSNLEKELLNITIGAGAPSEFYIGYLTDTGDGPWDYPDGLRFKQATGGAGDSTLITTVQDANKGVDIYFFRITGANPGDVITTSGFETLGGVNYYNLTASGLLFTQYIPEPASLSLLSLAVVALASRAKRSMR